MHHLPGIMLLSNTSNTRGVAVLDSLSNLLLSFLAYRFFRTLPGSFLHLHEVVMNMHEHVLEHVVDGVNSLSPLRAKPC
jgi:hypothetical protein